MTTNKVLFLLVILVIGINFFFNKYKSYEINLNSENQDVPSSKSQKKHEEIVKNFAQSLEKNPNLLANNSIPTENISVNQAIDLLLQNENNLKSFNLNSSYKHLLLQKKQEVLPLIINRYLNIDIADHDSEKQKLLNLAIELCNNDTDTSCADFLHAEALNHSLSTDQQMNAFKGYINTMGVGKEEKLELVSAFRNKNPLPELKLELDNIEEYVRNNNSFIQTNSELNEGEREPSSDLNQ
jgi:hypothetical protein